MVRFQSFRFQWRFVAPVHRRARAASLLELLRGSVSVWVRPSELNAHRDQRPDFLALPGLLWETCVKQKGAEPTGRPSDLPIARLRHSLPASVLLSVRGEGLIPEDGRKSLDRYRLTIPGTRLRRLVQSPLVPGTVPAWSSGVASWVASGTSGLLELEVEGLG